MTCHSGDDPSVSFLDTTTVGDTNDYDSPWIAVYYVSDCVDRSYLDEAYNFVIDCLDWTYSAGYISGYTVKKRAINGWCPDCCSDTEIWKQWNCERDDLLLTHVGEHALIHQCRDDECDVARGTRDGENPWETDCGAVIANNEGIHSKGGVAATVMHEALHGHCRANLCSNVADMTDGDEHDLGIIREVNGNHLATPLGNSTSADQGTCDRKSNSDSSGSTYRLSKCERKGMRESAEHTAGLHD